MAHHVQEMEHKLHAIDKKFQALGNIGYPEQMLAIIKRPGFTTLAEAMLIHTLLDQMQAQVETLGVSCAALVAAAEKVGTH